MKKVMVAGVTSLILLFGPASADELLQACIGVVEAEDVPEGIAGCQCLVDVADGKPKVTQELLRLADTPPEERILNAEMSGIIGKCFALDDSEEA